jgi:hypothetical protein
MTSGIGTYDDAPTWYAEYAKSDGRRIGRFAYPTHISEDKISAGLYILVLEYGLSLGGKIIAARSKNKATPPKSHASSRALA